MVFEQENKQLLYAQLFNDRIVNLPLAVSEMGAEHISEKMRFMPQSMFKDTVLPNIERFKRIALDGHSEAESNQFEEFFAGKNIGSETDNDNGEVFAQTPN